MSGQDDARDFLDALTGFTEDDPAGYTPSQDRPPRLATVDPAYSGVSNPKVTFDGELTMSTKTYPYLGDTPPASSRVLMLPVGRGYLIAGVVGGVPAPTPVGYQLVDVLEFTANGTFTKATYPWLRAIRVKVQAGGGAGGGAAATSGGTFSIGTGGGGGGYAEAFITNIAGLAASVTVTRGAGGAAASGTTGGAGGASSFGALVAAGGGGGGLTKPGNVLAPYIGPGAGGVGTAGDILIAGSAGGMGTGYSDLGAGGTGGHSHEGGGGAGGSSGSTGNPGSAGGLYGGGGGGAMNSGGQSARAGGAGANGIVIVEVYA